MKETLDYINPRRFGQNFKIPSDDIFDLSRLGIEKRGMRKNISEFLTEYVRLKIEGKPLSLIRTKARSIVRDIDKLNRTISKTEKLLLKAKSKRAK